jgi:two-component system NtrC family sensor kinase
LENENCCDDIKSDVEVIIRETLRCRDIVKHLLDFARQDTPKFEYGTVNNVILHSLDLVHKLPQFKDITIHKNLTQSSPTIYADLKQIEQVLLNLFINSADAMNYKGSIYIQTIYNRNENKAIIKIKDTGPGIPETVREKIFEPFFSTKNTSGLGLAVCKGIIERHHGRILVENSEHGGACFSIILPVSFVNSKEVHNG